MGSRIKEEERATPRDKRLIQGGSGVTGVGVYLFWLGVDQNHLLTAVFI